MTDGRLQPPMRKPCSRAGTVDRGRRRVRTHLRRAATAGVQAIHRRSARACHHCAPRPRRSGARTNPGAGSLIEYSLARSPAWTSDRPCLARARQAASRTLLPLPANANHTMFRGMVNLARRDNLTVRQLIRALGGGDGHRIIVGTPEQIADDIEAWFKAGAADGFNLMPDVLPSGLVTFVDTVVLLLQKRGLPGPNTRARRCASILVCRGPRAASRSGCRRSRQPRSTPATGQQLSRKARSISSAGHAHGESPRAQSAASRPRTVGIAA